MSVQQLRAQISNARTARAFYVAEGFPCEARTARRLERVAKRQLRILTGGKSGRSA